jgi:hypothetical protein
VSKAAEAVTDAELEAATDTKQPAMIYRYTPKNTSDQY